MNNDTWQLWLLATKWVHILVVRLSTIQSVVWLTVPSGRCVDQRWGLQNRSRATKGTNGTTSYPVRGLHRVVPLLLFLYGRGPDYISWPIPNLSQSLSCLVFFIVFLKLISLLVTTLPVYVGVVARQAGSGGSIV